MKEIIGENDIIQVLIIWIKLTCWQALEKAKIKIRQIEEINAYDFFCQR